VHRGRRLRVAVVVAFACAALLPGLARAETDLGPIGFGTVVVDNTRGHVYVSGPSANVVDVLDFSGGHLATIPNLPGAWGMALDARYLYVAESTAGSIARIDLDSPAFSVTQLANGLQQPHWLVMTSGKLWASIAVLPCCGWGSLASIDPKSGRTRVFTDTYYSPDLATSPGVPDTVFLAEDGLSSGSVYRIDVSAPPKLRVRASNPMTDEPNIQDLAVSPDGTRLLPAAGGAGSFPELNATTLEFDGLVYPGDTYPVAVATSPGRGGLLATGLTGGYVSPDIAVYPLGQTSPIFTATTLTWNGTANVRPHGLALTADGSRLFAVTDSDVYGTNTIFNSFLLP
jgi:hypothetical protein